MASIRKYPLGGLVAAVIIASAAAFALPALSPTARDDGAQAAGTRHDSAPIPSADPTRVMVRVLAHDAKLIGSGVGGATVTITDVESGKLLARGTHAGGTGDTRLIMSEPHTRTARRFSTPGAAGFLAELALDQPTVVRIEATGPGSPAGAAMTASRTLLLVPGRDVLGDGIVLELYGFRVELVLPDGLEAVRGAPLDVTASVTMMCGCPTEPGGMWDASGYEVVARLLDGRRPITETALAFNGTTSHFSGSLTPPAPGNYQLEVLAIDTASANFGRARRELTVR